MTNPLRDDEGDIRLMGSAAFIDAAIQRIGSAVDVSYDGNLRTNRHGEGSRAHAHIRLTNPAGLVADVDDEPSPREAAEQAKSRRDIGGELDALMAADRELRAQPWFPIQPGDVVCWSIDMPDGGRHGETLLAVHDPDWSTEAGAPLRKVSETPYELIGAAEDDLDDDGADEPPNQGRVHDYQDFYDIWFEAGPARIAVIRHGRRVHGTVYSAPVPASR